MRIPLYFPSLIELIEKKGCVLFFKVIIIVINFGQENESIELNKLDVYLEKIIFHYQTIFFSMCLLYLDKREQEDKNTIFLQLFDKTLEMKIITEVYII